jgi:hydroxypyruvate reductase/glycerate 2-kinase
MAYIKNTGTLLSQGNVKLRQTALEIIEAALAGADPYKATCDLLSFKENVLTVGDLRYELTPQQRIFLLGAGKATYPIARALEDILGNRITYGVVVCKYGQEGKLSRSRLYLSSHPIPDEAGFSAAREALYLAGKTGPGDIIFGCITGGSSALLPYPVPGISLDDKKEVNQVLLTCGANIIEINAVRKHLSLIKGGRLAQAIHPDAHLINLTVSDVIGDPLDYITDPTVPDTSDFLDARATLSKYDLWGKVPSSVSQYLRGAGPDQETPKEKDLSGHHRSDFVIVAGDAACVAAADKAKELGFNTIILSTMLEGESRELGRTFAAIANEIVLNQRPLKSPCAVIGGGETTVKILENTVGIGGPNQEFAVGASPYIDDIGSVVVVGFDSDGTDGPTDLAGAIVDEKTASRAQALDIDINACLNRHDVTPAVLKLQDAIITGSTGTNVNDLKIMLISE